MAKFFYVAKNKNGKVEQGETVVSSERELVEDLKKRGFWITSLREVKEDKKAPVSFGIGQRVPLKSKMIFCRHLGVMIESGMSLSRALAVLCNQEKNKNLKKTIEGLAANVKKGISLADAMAKYPKVFNAVFVSMVRVGEVSGNLEEILKILANQLEKDYKLISKVRGAMIYPAVIVSLMVILGIVMMTFVIPKLTQIFKDFGAGLPLTTRIIIAVSDFMANNVILVFASLFGLVFGFIFFSRQEQGKRIFHKIYLKLPVLGQIVSKVNSARFSRILGSLLESGVSLIEALKITSDTLGNYYFKKIVLKSSNDVQKGVSLSKILKDDKNETFPYLVIQMLEVGEETGKTSSILLKLAEFYEEDVDQITKNLSSIIEPVLMVIIGSAVGLFAISIIQPIYSIMNSM